jgi:hypothetical protein
MVCATLERLKPGIVDQAYESGMTMEGTMERRLGGVTAQVTVLTMPVFVGPEQTDPVAINTMESSGANSDTHRYHDI